MKSKIGAVCSFQQNVLVLELWPYTKIKK